jgi:hypothetical protein
MLDITFPNRTTEDKFRAFFDNAFDLSILRAPQPWGVALDMPLEWDLEKHSDCPLAVAMKTNTRDNAVFHPYRSGNILLSNRETGALAVWRAWIPKEESIRVAPDPEVGLTTHASLEWARIDGAKVAAPDSRWRIFFLMGGSLTGPLEFQTKSSKLRWEDHMDWQALMSPPGPGGLEAPVDPESLDTTSPEAGIRLEASASPKGGRETGLQLAGTFGVLDDAPWPVHWVEIHLVFTSELDRRARLSTVRIPKEQTKTVNGLVSGSFRLDLLGMFARGGLPAKTFVTAICRDLAVGPIELGDLGAIVASARGGEQAISRKASGNVAPSDSGRASQERTDLGFL